MLTATVAAYSSLRLPLFQVIDIIRDDIGRLVGVTVFAHVVGRTVFFCLSEVVRLENRWIFKSLSRRLGLGSPEDNSNMKAKK